MTTTADPIQPDPDLYPDVVAAGGSLVSALAEVARQSGIAIRDAHGPVSQTDAWRLIVAAVDDERGGVILTLGRTTRTFKIRVWLTGVGDSATGSLDDLAMAAMFINDWRNGLRLDEIPSKWPQIDVNAKALAHERNDAVAFQWQHIRNLAPRLIDHHIVDAAFVEPVLRGLFPMVSHGSLQFSRCTRFPFSNDVPSLFPLSDGRWRVHRLWTQDTPPEDADSAAEAIGLVVAGLPADCGPAIEGSRQQLLSSRSIDSSSPAT